MKLLGRRLTTGPEGLGESLRERLEESLTAAIVAGVVVGAALGALLARVPLPGPPTGGEQQLSLVGTLLGAAATVTGVVLSIVVVALQLASQQYSPRAVRTVLRDRRTRVGVGVLFAYLGLGVGVVQGADPQSPSLGASVAIVGVLVLLGAVGVVVQHLASGLRPEVLVARVGADALAAVRHIVSREDQDEQIAHPAERIGEGPAGTVTAEASGYLNDVDLDEIVAELADLDARVEFSVCLGDFVARGDDLASFWPQSADQDAVGDVVRRHTVIAGRKGTRREVSSDVQQLTDFAVRALSPAINDPRTAVEAVNEARAVLVDVASRDQTHLVGGDPPRVLVRRPLLWDLTDLVLGPVRRVADRHPEVLIALVAMMSSIVDMRPQDADLGEERLDGLAECLDRSDLLERDKAAVRDALAAARSQG